MTTEEKLEKAQNKIKVLEDRIDFYVNFFWELRNAETKAFQKFTDFQLESIKQDLKNIKERAESWKNNN